MTDNKKLIAEALEWKGDNAYPMIEAFVTALEAADESHLRGHWSNGDPVHIVTDGVDRWIAPNHNGATWIEDAS